MASMPPFNAEERSSSGPKKSSMTTQSKTRCLGGSRTSCQHGLAFGSGPSSSPYPKATGKQRVHNMRADEAGGACNEDVGARDSSG